MKNDGDDDGRREVEVEEVEQGRRGLKINSYKRDAKGLGVIRIAALLLPAMMPARNLPLAKLFEDPGGSRCFGNQIQTKEDSGTDQATHSSAAANAISDGSYSARSLCACKGRIGATLHSRRLKAVYSD